MERERERGRERKKGNRDAVSLHMITIHSFPHVCKLERTLETLLGASYPKTGPPL